MWNSQLQQHLDQFHKDNDNTDDSTSTNSIKEPGDHKQQKAQKSSGTILSDDPISQAATKMENQTHGFFNIHLNKQRRSFASLFTVCCMLMATVVMTVNVARSCYLSEMTTTATTAAAVAVNATCNINNNDSIQRWCSTFATLFGTFLAGWHGGRISIFFRINGGSSHHEDEQKTVPPLDYVVPQNHPAVVEEKSWNDEKVSDHHRIVDDSSSCQHHQQLRLRLVELLGTIGAPPLVLMEQEEDESHHQNQNQNHHHYRKKLDSVEECLKSTENQTSKVAMNNDCNYNNFCQQRQELEHHHHYDKVLIEFCEAQVDWIQTLDQALTLLRVSTSIQFGGGGNGTCRSNLRRNNVVERIERAAVGRWRRCQRQVTKTTTTKQNIATYPPLHLPLARIRRRCAEALQRQEHCLQSILLAPDTAGEVEEEEGSFENEEIPCDDVVRFKSEIDMNVITIHSLRLARDDTALLLARIVDNSIKNYTYAVANFSENSCALLQQATQRAREEEAHLSACCRFTPTLDTDNDRDSEGILTVDHSMGSCSDIMLDPLNQGISNFQLTTSSLQVALLSFQDAVLEQQQKPVPGGGDIIRDWWQRVDSLSRTMLAAKYDVEQLVLQPISTSKGGNDDEKSRNDKAVGGALANENTDEKQDFVADATQAVTTPSSATTHHDELHSSKTLLFSGSGTVVIGKENRFEKKTRSNNSVNVSYSASASTSTNIIAAEQSLIQELETYLRCMPAPEEVNVTSSTDPLNIPTDGNENNLNGETTNTEDVCKVSNGMKVVADQPCGLLSILPMQQHGLFLGELTSSIQKQSNNISTDYMDDTG